MADVDEALVFAVGEVVANALDESEPGRPNGCLGCWPLWTETSAHDAARAVLTRLAATGRLVGEGEERVEWGCKYHRAPIAAVGLDGKPMTEESANAWAAEVPDVKVVSRTVRTWTAPDGATGTLVGPWVEVEG